MEKWLTDEQFKRIKGIIQANKSISYQGIERVMGFVLSDVITEERFDAAYVNGEVKEFDKDGNGFYTIHLG